MALRLKFRKDFFFHNSRNPLNRPFLLLSVATSIILLTIAEPDKIVAASPVAALMTTMSSEFSFALNKGALHGEARKDNNVFWPTTTFILQRSSHYSSPRLFVRNCLPFFS